MRRYVGLQLVVFALHLPLLPRRDAQHLGAHAFQAGCDDGKYSPYATLLMQSAAVVKALFLRSAPRAVLPGTRRPARVVCLHRARRRPLLPVGLMLPMIDSAMGRSFGLALLMILKDHALDGDTRATEPGLSTLVGATALWQERRIRLFLTV